MSLITPELLRRLEQFQLLAARRALSASAKRIKVNSRGCQPTERQPTHEVDPEKVKLDPTNPRVGFSMNQLTEDERNDPSSQLVDRLCFEAV